MKLKPKDIAGHRSRLLAEQSGLCAICLKQPARPCLDHNHSAPGNIRGVLCLGCNLLEGKIANSYKRCQVTDLSGWLRQLATYYDKHRAEPSDIIHSAYRTQDEKNERRKSLNRSRRTKLKETK